MSVLLPRTFPGSSLLVFATLLLPVSALAAQSTPVAAPPVDPRIAGVIAELEKTRAIYQTALSPDGQMIAWEVEEANGSRIEIASTAEPSHFRRITAGSGAVCIE